MCSLKSPQNMVRETGQSLNVLPASGDYSHGGRPRRDSVLPALLNPVNHFRWLAGFGQSWVLSRDYGRLTSSIPFWILIVAVVFLTWLRHAPDDEVVASYQSALEAAVNSGDAARQEVYLNALVQLRPRDPEVRFQRAKLLLSQGRNEGIDFISPLVPDETDGYAPARMWLVEQASRPNPVVPLTDSQIQNHLTRILSQRQDDPQAHRWLARILLRQSDLKGAETHLELAARTLPDLNVELAKLKAALQRDPAEIHRYASRGADELTGRLRTDPDNMECRLALGEALILLGQFDAARELLTARADLSSDPRLRRSLSDLEIASADRLLADSLLNQDVCGRILLKALELDPSNLTAVQRIAELHAAGTHFQRSEIEASLNYWQQQLTERQDQEGPRRILSQLLAVVGAAAEAAEVLRPVVLRRPELRLSFARLLTDAGAKDEASAVLQLVELEVGLELLQNPDSVTAAEQKTESLMIGGRPAEALKFLQKLTSRNQAGRIPEAPSLKALFGRASIQVYDSLILSGGVPAGGSENAPQPDESTLLQLLADAVSSQTSAAAGMDRLAQLALSQHPAAARAEEMIRQYRLTEASEQEMLNRLGTQALVVGDYQKARTCLEQANQLSRGGNPMTLNNLAIAVARGESRDLTAALELANQALLQLPGHPDVLSTRGEILLELGRWPEAIQDLEQAVSMRRDSREVHELLLRAYTATNATEKVEAHQRELKRISENNPG